MWVWFICLKKLPEQPTLKLKYELHLKLDDVCIRSTVAKDKVCGVLKRQDTVEDTAAQKLQSSEICANTYEIYGGARLNMFESRERGERDSILKFTPVRPMLSLSSPYCTSTESYDVHQCTLSTATKNLGNAPSMISKMWNPYSSPKSFCPEGPSNS